MRQYCIEPTVEYPITVRHCQALEWDCNHKAEVFCLCGCERQVCRDCALREFVERQGRMAVAMINHRGCRELVIAKRIRRGEPAVTGTSR